MYPSAEEVMKNLKAEIFLQYLSPDWDKVLVNMPGTVPAFLEDEAIRDATEFCRLTDEEIKYLQETAAIIRNSKDLSALAWYSYWKMYIAPQEDRFLSKHTVDLGNAIGSREGSFYLLIAISITPFIKSYHHALGVPLEITRDTVFEIKCFMDMYKLATGNIGIKHKNMPWIENYLHGNLFFRLGRFEYWCKPCPPAVPSIYRNKNNGQVAAFAANEKYFSEAGYSDAAAVQNQDDNYWSSKFVSDENFVTGNPINPANGSVFRKQIKLPLSDWECVLNKDMTILDMHIPGGGAMTPEACADSFKKAIKFYKSHFPNQKIAAITCPYSWIFSPNLFEILPESANLCKLMKEIYLYPIENSYKKDGLGFFFFTNTFDPKTAPRKTSLQRAVAAHLEKGGEFRAGGMFVLADETDAYGKELYRNKFPYELLKS